MPKTSECPHHVLILGNSRTQQFELFEQIVLCDGCFKGELLPVTWNITPTEAVRVSWAAATRRVPSGSIPDRPTTTGDANGGKPLLTHSQPR